MNRSRIVIALSLLVMLGWSIRESLLFAAGDLLVTEDPVEPVDAIVASVANPAGAALEAARLYRQGIAREIVLCTFVSGPVEEEVRRLGIPHLRPAELAKAVLEKKGVHPSAIVVLAQPVDGTGSEVGAVAAYAQEHHRSSLLYITQRSHTARARWLLRHALPPGTRVIVRSPRGDSFDAGDWWQRRDQAREVAEEYLRWMNALVLRDPWNGETASTN